MTTKFLDNKICTFKLLLSWRFAQKQVFLDDLPLCPQAPPPQKRKCYFYCRLAVSEWMRPPNMNFVPQRSTGLQARNPETSRHIQVLALRRNKNHFSLVTGNCQQRIFVTVPCISCNSQVRVSLSPHLGIEPGTMRTAFDDLGSQPASYQD